jgi:PTH1 family peptidyl-tRNA hydrolase
LWALVGLGNPGKEYAETRHNAGFTFVKRVARDWGLEIRKKKFLAKTAETRRDGEIVLLALPQTYMNRSGHSVREMLDFYRLGTERLLVVTDDLDIPLGEIRVRKEGGAGTHNGMRSIVEWIETTAFPRIRVGIGPLPPDRDPADFVLSRFSPEESKKLSGGLTSAREALDMILADGIDRAMNSFNKRTLLR